MKRAAAIIATVALAALIALVFWVTDAERRAQVEKARADYAETLLAAAGIGYVRDAGAREAAAKTGEILGAMYALPANAKARPKMPPAGATALPDVNLDFGDGPPNPPGTVIFWARRGNGALVFQFKRPADLVGEESSRIVTVDEMKAMARREWNRPLSKTRPATSEAIPGDEEEVEP